MKFERTLAKKRTEKVRAMSEDVDFIMCSKCGKMPKLKGSDLCYDCRQSLNDSTVTVHVEKPQENDLKAENEDLKAKLDSIAQMEFTKRKNALPLRFRDKVNTPEQLELAEALALEDGSRNESAPSGSAPLNQTSGSIPNERNTSGYADYKAMLADLRAKERFGNEREQAEAKRLIDALFLKLVREAKKNPDVWRQAEGRGENIKDE